MNVSPYIADVNQANFSHFVLEKSQELPVLVDFWAAWCGPCQMLMPILTKLANDYQGKFFLAKVNTDQETALATKYGIRSLPTVKLFKNGEVVNEFMGVQPERALRSVLDRYVTRESDSIVVAALQDYQNGDIDTALDKLQTALQTDPANDRIKLQLIKMLLEQRRPQEGEEILKALSPEARSNPEAANLRVRIEFTHITADAPPAAELERMLNVNPGDTRARYLLSILKVLNNDYEPALEQLLEIVKQDRKFQDDAARKAILVIFNLLGGKGELVNRYRQLLSLALH